jgi:hypothetical protein
VQYAFVDVNAADDYNDNNDDDDTNNIKADNVNCSAKDLSMVSAFLFMAESADGRPQWPRGLLHEPSWLALTLGSWVRIPFEAWMFVCVYCVFVLSCV